MLFKNIYSKLIKIEVVKMKFLDKYKEYFKEYDEMEKDFIDDEKYGKSLINMKIHQKRM